MITHIHEKTLACACVFTQGEQSLGLIRSVGASQQDRPRFKSVVCVRLVVTYKNRVTVVLLGYNCRNIFLYILYICTYTHIYKTFMSTFFIVVCYICVCPLGSAFFGIYCISLTPASSQQDRYFYIIGTLFFSNYQERTAFYC